MSFEFTEWYAEVVKNDTILNYKGAVSKDDIAELLAKIEIELERKDEDIKVIRKIYNIAVEILQNLFHHSDSLKGEDKKVCAFILKDFEDNKYALITGNYIKKNKLRLLKDRLDQINFLNSEELKVLYKIVLNNQQFSEKGGGGLGMIDVARKSGSKILYNFYEFDNDYYFYTFSVAI
jgi:hypothetical protein